MPMHTGHMQLIKHALSYCKQVTVLLCSKPTDPISGSLRYKRIKEIYKGNKAIQVIHMDYSDMPDSKRSSRRVSKAWAKYINENFPQVQVIVSSEKYGEFVAEYANIKYIIFDQRRTTVPISGTKIRKDPIKYWDFIPPNVKPYFVKKVVLLGTESTGKSTFAKKLAEYYNTNYVPEKARDIMKHTQQCTPQHLQQIAKLHAQTINECIQKANKVLIIDTDITITASYSTFLFDKTLQVPDWVQDNNRADLYVFLDNDSPYIQDGTRLSEIERNKLHIHHQQTCEKHNIKYHLLSWTRFDKRQKAVKLINRYIYQTNTIVLSNYYSTDNQQTSFHES